MGANQRDATWDLHEPGFDGRLAIEDGVVRVTGTRPQDGSEIIKDVPADRDPELSALVGRALGGEDDVAVQLLAHVGVLDPG